MDVPAGPGLVALFIIQQVHAFLRIAVRMLFIAAQTGLFLTLSSTVRKSR